MGWCKDTVKPAVRRIRQMLTQSLLREIAQGMKWFAPLIEDGKLDGKEAAIAVTKAIQMKRDVSATAISFGIGLIHETVKRGEAELADWYGGDIDDPQGEAEIDAMIEA